MTETPSETTVESLAEQIDGRPWAVTGYDFEGGSEQSFTVTLDIEWVGTELAEPVDSNDHQAVQDIIETVAVDYQAGAPISEIVARAEDAEIPADRVRELLDELRRRGDVYEPTTDHLRVV